MIFDIEKYCTLSAQYDSSNSNGKFTLGKDGELNIALLSSGSGTVIAANGSALINAGYIVVSDSKIVFSPSAEPYHIMGLGLIGQVAEDLKKMLTAADIWAVDSIYCPEAPELILKLCSTQEYVLKFQVSSFAFSLICAISASDRSIKSRLPSLVSEAINLMHGNFAGVYGVEEVAEQMNVSKSHLVRVFSAEMGVTPGKYLTAVRMDAAKQLLIKNEYSVDMIALMCGYSNANYFCKVFKKENGSTPVQWRKDTFGQIKSYDDKFLEEMYLY